MNTDNLLLNSIEFKNGSNPGSSPISKIVSSKPAFKMGTDDFQDLENEITDCDGLLTPVGAPLFPYLETKSQKFTMSQMGTPDAHPVALQSRPVNSLANSASGTDAGNKRSVSSGGSASAKCRPATPTGASSLQRKIKPSRSSKPASCSTLPTTESAKPPVRSSASSDDSTVCSSTPIARPSVLSSRSTSRSATPTRPLSTMSSVSAPLHRSSSVKKSAPSRGSSPTVRSKHWKAAEKPGFSLVTPPNLRTSLQERPASASRIRPAAPSTRAVVSGSVANGGTRQQTCSSSRERTRNGSGHGNKSFVLAKSRAQSNNSDNVNPILIGTQMVERVVNMRKLAPPKLDDHRSSQGHTVKKSSSSQNSSGFGRTLSKTSFDMALRHMDIGQAMSGSLRSSITKNSS